MNNEKMLIASELIKIAEELTASFFRVEDYVKVDSAPFDLRKYEGKTGYIVDIRGDDVYVQFDMGKPIKFKSGQLVKSDSSECLKPNNKVASVDPILQKIGDAIKGKNLVDCRAVLEGMFSKKDIDFSWVGCGHFYQSCRCWSRFSRKS